MKVIIRNDDGSVSKVYEIPGIPGKSAYQYAQDGGFTGTEAEFVEKLSQVPLTGDTTTVLPSVVHSSMLLGIPVGLTHTDPTYGTMAFSGFSYSHAANNSIVASVNFKIADVALCAQLTGNISTDEWSFSTTGLALPSDIPTKVSQLENDALLTGSTTNITPTQVYEEVLAGRDVVISHTDTYGVFTFDSFAHSDAFKVVFATAIIDMQGTPIAVGLYGTLQNNAWDMSITSLATRAEIPTALPTPNQLKFMPGKNEMMTDLFPLAFNGSDEQIVRIPTLTSHLENDSGFLTQAPVSSVNGQTGEVKINIPTALPNPQPLTINGETYDGSSAVDITEQVNALITAKMNEIANAEGVAF